MTRPAAKVLQLVASDGVHEYDALTGKHLGLCGTSSTAHIVW